MPAPCAFSIRGRQTKAFSNSGMFFRTNQKRPSAKKQTVSLFIPFCKTTGTQAGSLRTYNSLRAPLQPDLHSSRIRKKQQLSQTDDPVTVSTCLLLKLMELLPSGKSCRFPHGSVQRTFSASAFVPYRRFCSFHAARTASGTKAWKPYSITKIVTQKMHKINRF